MVGCCAFGCSGRSEKGFLMKYFPKDPIRRKAWIDQVNREAWSPSTSAALCEAHFEPCMWEKTRVDGTRKLKLSAIPTIFPINPKMIKEKVSSKTVSLSDSNKIEEVQMTFDHPSRNHEGNMFGTISVVDISKLSCAVLSESNLLPLTEKTTNSKVNTTDFAGNEKNAFCGKLNEHKPNRKKILIKDTQSKRENIQVSSSNIKIFENIFNVDQIEAINGTSIKWRNATIENALKLKFTYGTNLYKELSQKLTIPSLKSLEDHLLNIKFEGGILNEVLAILKLKISNFTSCDQKDCAIFLKEVPITRGDIYEATVGKELNNMILNKHAGMATHILVVIVGGISMPWEQIIALYFTGYFVNTSMYKNIILKIIDKIEQLGLKVISITSDIDSSREAVWKSWNISTEDDTTIKNYITHPFDSSRNIFILADVSNLFKNIKNMITANKNIVIPSDIQEQYFLASNTAESHHIEDLINFQDKLDYKLVPTSQQNDLIPEYFKKIASEQVVNHDVVSALNFVANKLNKPEYKTTGWLIETVERWFTIMTTNNPAAALSKQNLDIYNTNICFLREFIQLFCEMQINGKTCKPHTRIGIILSTQSILDIQKIFLNQKGYAFLPTSRLTQHCLENLQILHADATKLKNNLKLICVSQLIKDPPSNIWENNRAKLLSEAGDIINLQIYTLNSDDELCYGKLNSLCRICSYILSNIKKTTKTCKNCINSIRLKTGDNSNYKKLFLKGIYKKNSTFFCNDLTFEFFIKLEKTFCKLSKSFKDKHTDIKNVYFVILDEIKANHILLCHNLKKKIVQRFLSLKLGSACKKKTQKV